MNLNLFNLHNSRDLWLENGSTRLKIHTLNDLTWSGKDMHLLLFNYQKKISYFSLHKMYNILYNKCIDGLKPNSSAPKSPCW